MKHPRILQLGLVFLVLANTGSWFFRRVHLNESFADPASGFLYGLAIGTMLLGILVARRTSRPDRTC